VPRGSPWCRDSTWPSRRWPPRRSFAGVEFYPDFVSKAAVLCAHLAWNHPLLDGNKRAAWLCLGGSAGLRGFCRRNGFDLWLTVDDAVAVMLAVAAHEVDQMEQETWIRSRIEAAS
jgi:death-on-curing protein